MINALITVCPLASASFQAISRHYAQPDTLLLQIMDTFHTANCMLNDHDLVDTYRFCNIVHHPAVFNNLTLVPLVIVQYITVCFLL